MSYTTIRAVKNVILFFLTFLERTNEGLEDYQAIDAGEPEK